MATEDETINSNRPPNRYGTKSTLAQSLAAVAQSFVFFGLGMYISMPAIVIRDLFNKTDNEFSITATEASWYGSLLFVTHPIGCFLSGYLQQWLGKKQCMVIANVPGIAGLIILYMAYSSAALYMSVLLMGFSMGFGAGATSSYVGEISEPRLRGSLGSLGSTALRLGASTLYTMAYFFDWRTVALCCVISPVVCICLVLIIPESPIWLMSQGKTKKAEQALCWLRGWVEPEKVKDEFLELVHYNEVSGTLGDKAKINSDDGNEGFASKFAHFMEPSVYRPLRLLMIYFFVSYVNSIFPTRPFITKIMEKVDLFVNQNESLVILSIMTNVGSIISTATVHRFGKRFLTLWTLFINTTLLFMFGAYIIAVKNGYIQSSPWIALTILCSIYLIGSCGISCISWMLLIEIFPNKNREITTSTCTALAYILLFALTKSYLPIEMFLSLEYTMILFGGISVFGLIYFYFYLPETENKTLLEIEHFFISNSKN